MAHIEIDPTPDLAAVPEEHRRTIARWLLARGGQYRPSFVLSSAMAMVIQDAFTGAAVDVASPSSEDSTLAHAAGVLRSLYESNGE